MIITGCSHYTGVGSRETPIEIQELMGKIAYTFAENGVIGRSGSAVGADMAFEIGHIMHPSGCGFESFLPWDGFNHYHGDKNHIVAPTLPNYNKAIEIIKTIHPRYYSLSAKAKALHTRNVYQVLGATLDMPSKYFVCWAIPKSINSVNGGTNTAYQLARIHGLKIYNLYFDRDINAISTLLGI